MAMRIQIGPDRYPIIGTIAAALIGGVFIFVGEAGRAKPPTLLDCRFAQPSSRPGLRIPSGRYAVADPRIQATLALSKDGKMYSVDGVAAGFKPGANAKAAVTGAVFPATDGTVDGLFLIVEHADFGGNNLTISTLDKDGQLDRDRTTAFLAFGRADKLGYPASYKCSITQS